MRGHQFKSEGPGEAKKNQAPFTRLNDGKEKNADVSTTTDVYAHELEGQGFAVKTVAE